MTLGRCSSSNSSPRLKPGQTVVAGVLAIAAYIGRRDKIVEFQPKDGYQVVVTLTREQNERAKSGIRKLMAQAQAVGDDESVLALGELLERFRGS